MKKPKKSPTKPKEKRGKQHPLHAESLDRIAEALMDMTWHPTSGDLAQVFYKEADRVRGIVR